MNPIYKGGLNANNVIGNYHDFFGAYGDPKSIRGKYRIRGRAVYIGFETKAERESAIKSLMMRPGGATGAGSLISYNLKRNAITDGGNTVYKHMLISFGKSDRKGNLSNFVFREMSVSWDITKMVGSSNTTASFKDYNVPFAYYGLSYSTLLK
jgi:hypothetical protein